MSENIFLNIAKEFSRNPGARHSADGDFPGELYLREEISNHPLLQM